MQTSWLAAWPTSQDRNPCPPPCLARSERKQREGKQRRQNRRSKTGGNDQHGEEAVIFGHQARVAQTSLIASSCIFQRCYAAQRLCSPRNCDSRVTAEAPRSLINCIHRTTFYAPAVLSLMHIACAFSHVVVSGLQIESRNVILVAFRFFARAESFELGRLRSAGVNAKRQHGGRCQHNTQRKRRIV